MTTEQFLLNELKGLGLSSKLIEQNKLKAISILNKFAKYHVQKALKEASEKAEVEATGKYEMPYIVDKDSILNAYPESNIV